MGKPNNTKPAGCVTTSSNCVIWQGPDIDFLDLCKGDSISVVMKQFADKICLLQNMLSPNSYDFGCLDDSNCGPKTFIDLFQLVLDKVCELNTSEASQTTTTSSTAVENYELAVATCFQYNGVVQTLPDYLTEMGQFICQQNTVIQTQTNAIAQLNLQVTNMQAQLDLLIQG